MTLTIAEIREKIGSRLGTTVNGTLLRQNQDLKVEGIDSYLGGCPLLLTSVLYGICGLVEDKLPALPVNCLGRDRQRCRATTGVAFGDKDQTYVSVAEPSNACPAHITS